MASNVICISFTAAMAAALPLRMGGHVPLPTSARSACMIASS